MRCKMIDNLAIGPNGEELQVVYLDIREEEQRGANMTDPVTILTIVGEIAGAAPHIAPVVGGAIAGATLCGISTTGWLIGRRFMWGGQINCSECHDEYNENHRYTVDKWSDGKERG